MRRIACLRQNEHGAAAIEFALVLPVLLLAFYGVVELTRYMIFSEKLEGTMIQTLDAVNQTSKPTGAQINAVMGLVDDMMFPMAANPQWRLTAFERPRSPQVNRQCTVVQLWRMGTGPTRVTPASLPQLGITLGDNDTVNVMELTAAYTPLFDIAAALGMNPLQRTVYMRNFSRPRYGPMRCNPNGPVFATMTCPPPPCR